MKEILLFLIVAYVQGTRAIGYKGNLPWKRLSGDMQNFKNLTTGKIVIMGAGTYERRDEIKTLTSRPIKPLPNRHTIIVTRQKNYQPEGVTPENEKFVHVAHSVKEALELAVVIARENDINEIYFAGGEQIYKEAFALGIPIEVVATEVEGAENLPYDAVFPEMPEEYKEVRIDFRQEIDEKNDHAFNVKRYRPAA
jgi:dihydrofolate reductase